MKLAAIALAAAVAAAACESNAEPSGPRLRTFPWQGVVNGAPVLCPAFAVIPPVAGRLDGRADDPELAWLATPDGHRLSVVWPRGFNVAFAPDAVLRNEHGVVVARRGERVELGQVSVASAAGTPIDPYVAEGLVLGGCYPRQ